VGLFACGSTALEETGFLVLGKPEK
jgi:hypothetical protein